MKAYMSDRLIKLLQHQSTINIHDHKEEDIKYMTQQKEDSNPKDLIGCKKPNLSLVPPVANIYEAKVMEDGARKYGAYNWRLKKVRMTVYIDALLRHAYSLLDGEDVCSDSGHLHLASMRANTGILLDALATGNLIDDRPTKGRSGEIIDELGGVERKLSADEEITEFFDKLPKGGCQL